MSSQSAKKKRLGSRRQAPTQKAKPEDVDFHVVEDRSLAQSCKPEGNTETLDVLANLNEFPSETPSPPSAELTENRRKLGSSRRSKRAQHSKAADLHHREEVEEKTSNDQALQTAQLLVAMQPQKQEELSQRNEPSVSAMHDSSLYSSDGYFSEPAAVNSPEAVLNVLQSEQLKENADVVDVLTSVLSSPSSEIPFTNQSNPTKMPEELSQVFLADKEDSELLRHDGKLQNLDSESHLKPEVTEFLSTSGTPTISTSERSPEVNIHLEYCDEKEMFSSRLEEFPQSEEQSEHLSFQVYDAHYPSEDTAKNTHKQEDNLTQMEEVNNSSESVTHDTTENSEMLLRNLVDGAEASDSFESASKQEDYITKDYALGQINEVDRYEEDDTTLNAERRVDQQSEGILSDSEVSDNSLQTLKSDSQPTINSDSQESDIYLNPIGSRRKIGSTRRYKERQHAKGSVAETSHTAAEDVENIRETMLEKLSKVEEIQFDQFEENTNVETHVGIAEFTTLSSLSSSPVEQHLAEGSNSREMAGNKLPHMNPVGDADSNERDEDVESLRHGGNLQDYLKAGSHVTSEDMAESLVMPEVSTERSKPEPECKAGQVMMSLRKEQKLPAYEGQNEIISSSEAKVDHLSNNINSGPEKAVNQTNEVNNSSENVTHDVPETLEMNLGILASQAEISHVSTQSVVVSTDESAMKQEDSYPDKENEHPTEDSNSQTSEHTTEDYHVSDTKEVEVTGLESVGTAQRPVVSGKTEEAMLEEIDKSDTSQPEEISSESAHHSEAALNEVHDQEVDPTQTHEGSNSLENVMHDTIGQVDWTVLDATPSGLTEKNMEDPAIKKEDSNSDEKNDVLLTEQSSHVALDLDSEDYFVSVTKEVEITGLESVGTALSPVYEIEVQVQDDKILSGEQTAHQENDSILSVLESSDCSSETKPSEEQPLSDSQPQQDDPNFHPTISRRKLGSSRRNKGRQYLKESVAESANESKEETVESTESGEALPVTHDSSLYSEVMQSYSSEDHKPTELSNPETNLGVLVPESENLQRTQHEKHSDFGVEVSGKTEEAMLEEIDKSETPQPEEISSESAHHSEDALNEMHDQEVDPTQTHEGNNSLENVTHDTMGQVDWTVLDATLSGLTEKNMENPAIKKEDSNSDEKNDVLLTEQSSHVALDLDSENYFVSVTKEVEITGLESVGTTLSPVYEIEVQVQDDKILSGEQTAHQENDSILSVLESSDCSSETKPSEEQPLSDSQPQQDDPNFHPTISRRKLGSSRRNKGRQYLKESVAESASEGKEETVESTESGEALPVTHDSSLYSEVMQSYSSEDHKPTELSNPETNLGVLVPESENLQRTQHEKHSDFGVEVSGKTEEAMLEEIDKSDTPQPEEISSESAHHSEDALNEMHDQEVDPTQTREGNNSLENVTHDTMGQVDWTVLDATLSGLTEKNMENPAIKKEDSNSDEKNDVLLTEQSSHVALDLDSEDYFVSVTKEVEITGLESVGTALSPVYEIEVQVQDDKILSGEQTAHQENDSILSVLESSDCSSETKPSEEQPLSDSQPQQDDPNFHPTISRRKLGSSRRNKGRQYLKESVAESANESKEETVESTESGEALPVTHDSSLYSEVMQSYSSEDHKPTELSNPETNLGVLVPESENLQRTQHEKHSDFGVEVSGKTEEAMLEEIDKSETPQPEEISSESAHHSEDALNEMHDQEVDPTQTREGNNSLENVTHDTMGQVDWTVLDATLSGLTEKNMENPAIKKEDSNSDEKNDVLLTEQSSHVALDLDSENYFVSVTKEVEITGLESVGTTLSPVYEIEVQVQDDKILSGEQTAHQENDSILSVLESSDCSSETQPSEEQPLSDSQPQQDDPNFHPTISRRKLGSSRRNKGRQYLKESVAESASEGKEETVESTESGEALPVTHDSSLYSEVMQSYSSEDHKPTELSNPETNLGVLVPESENLQRTQHEKHSDFGVEVSGKTEEAMLEEIDKSETPQPEEISSESAHHSEDALNEMHDQEVDPTQTHEGNNSLENVTHDTMGQVDWTVLDATLSGLTEKNMENPAIKKEDSNSDEKNDVLLTEQSSHVALDLDSENYFVSVTKEVEITGLESVGTTLSPVYEIEVQVQDDKILSGEQTAHQENDSILSVLESSDCSSETKPSEEQPLSDSQPQQDDPNFHPTISRRKLGSSRRNKGRQYLKESVAESASEGKEETVESTESGEALPVTHDSSLYSEVMQSYSSEDHKPTELSNPETNLGVLVPESENLQRTQHEKHSDFGVEVSGKTEEAMLEEIDKSDTPQPEEISSESAHHSEDALNEMHDQEVDPTQTREGNNSLENVTHDTMGQVDWTVLDATLSGLTEKNMENPAIKKEDSNSDEKNDVLLTEQSSHVALDLDSENYFVSVTKEVEITGLESVGTTLSPVYEIEVQVQDDKILSGEQTAHQENDSILSVLESSDCSSETKPSEEQPLSDSQPQQDDPNFHPTISRRKLGSSRRNKGRQYLKESVAESASEGKEETVESTESGEALPVTHDSSLYSEVMQSYSSEDHKPTELSNPETNLGVLVPESENLQRTQHEKHSDFGVEVSGKTEEAMLEEIDKSETPLPEEISSESAHHSVDALNEMHDCMVDLTQTHEGNNSLENVTHDVMCQVKLAAKSTDGSAPKQENLNSDDKNDVHLTKESDPETLDRQNEHYLASVTKELKISDKEGVDTALGQLHTVEGLVEDDVKLNTEQTTHQEKEKVLSELEESESSIVRTIIQSETSAVFSFQSLDNPVSPEELIHADFNPTGSRRKLGSSQRNKGRQHADSASKSQRPNEEVVENTMDNELKATKRFSTNKTVVLGKSVEMEVWVDEMALTDSNAAEFPEQAIHVGIPESTSSNLHSTTDQLQIGGSNSSKIPQDEGPYMTSEAENENLDCTFLVTELHLGSEDLKASVKLEASTERHSPGEYKEPECSIEQAAMSTTEKQEICHSVTSDISTGKHSPEKHTDIEPSVEQAAGLAPDQQQECANPAEAEIPPHSEDVLSIVSEDIIKPTQVEEHDQTEPSSFKESEFPLQNLQSDVAASLDLYPQDSSVGIEQPTHISFSTIGTRRKLGSSRRNKARQHVRDANDAPHNEPGDKVVEMAMNKKSFETTKMSLVTETARQEELIKQTELDPNPTQEIRKIQSTVNDEELKDKMPGEDTILSQNVVDESEVMPANINSSSGKDDAVKSNKDTNEGAIKFIKEPENLARPDPLEFESLQSQDDSETQSMACRNGNFSTISVTVDVLEQGDADQIQQMEVVSYDKDSVEEEMTVQLPNNVVDTARDTAVNDCSREVESPTDAQVLKVGENFEKKDEEAQEMNISQKFTAAGPFSTAQDKNDASIPSAQSGIPLTSSNPQEIQGQSNFSCHDNLQHFSKQKKRKMGSTRRSQLKATREQEEALHSQAAAPESDFTLQADVQKVDKIEMVKESQKTAVVSQDLNPKKTTADEGQQLQSSVSEPRSSLVSDREVGTAVLSGHSACHNKDVTHNSIPEGSFMSLCESSQSTPKEDDRQESENVIQEQALKSTETPNVAAADLKIVQSEIKGGTGEEHADVQAGTQDPNAKKSLEMKNASPKLNSANPRRKMGSTRRNLTSRDKKEDLQQEREMDSEVKVGDIKAETSGTEGDSEQTQQKVFETVESSYTGESYLKPPSAHSFEESPVSHDQPVETEPPVPSIIPSTSPKHDVVTETASGGRRRKLGSHRRSRRSPGNENQTENGDRTMDTQAAVYETGIKTTEVEPLGLDRIPETDESNRQPTSIISTPTAAANLKTEGSAEAPVKVSPVKQTSANIRLGQDSQQAFSLGAAPQSSSYNVLMVGDSSVGKTSFMRRAQSGKFALDLPASVGLDSCRWTVVVDGKPVVLQVWDTAGQERFHSITRQVFHKAQAFILMYDITSCQSFSAISYWADCIQEGAAENVTILLVGNKSDRAERQVKAHEGENIAKEYDFEFMECSAATGENVIECLETVARMLSQRVDTRVDSTVLHKEPQQKKSSGCC